jgi:hypothetical protein
MEPYKPIKNFNRHSKLREIFSLLLRHGGDIYQDAGNGYSILSILIKKSFILQLFFITAGCIYLDRYIHFKKNSLSPIITTISMLCIDLDDAPVSCDYLFRIIKEKYWKQAIALGATTSIVTTSILWHLAKLRST